uniref:Putative ovule protein n=1 Tax=Solanum chacoense TaxID=4108 RepID=A0A0V0HIX6_SOLCH
MPAASQLRFLTRLRRDLENGNSETWGLIEREVRRWRPGSARRKVWGPVGQRKGKVLLPGRSRMTRECHVRFL